MIETGVNLTLTENASAASRRVSSELEQIAKSADGINSSFDPKALEEYERKLTQIGEKYSQLNSQVNRNNQTQARQMQSLIGTVSGAGMQAARGDIGGAAVSGVRGIGSLLTGMGAGGLLATAGIAGVAGANQLANYYESSVKSAQLIAGLQDDFTKDFESNSEAMREVMRSTVDSVAKYGKTYEEGAAARATFLRAGGRDFESGRSAAYSLAYGADFNRLASFAGLTQRYGQTGGLDVSRAVMRAQGLGPAQFEEVMGGIQDIFSSSLAQGVTRSLPEIARSMEFFGRGGQLFQGALGAQRLQGMNQAVAGAANLQSQQDVFLYRAASRLAQDRGGGILETRKLMEQGLTADMFRGLMDEFNRFGYGKTESVLQLSRMFGLSTEAAERLYTLKDQPTTSQELEQMMQQGMGRGFGRSTETEYSRLKEEVAQKGRMVGAGAFDLRTAALGAGEDAIGFLGDKLDEIKNSKVVQGISDTLTTIKDMLLGMDTPFVEVVGAMQDRGGYSATIAERIRQKAINKGIPIESFSGLTEDYLRAIEDDVVTKEEFNMLAEKLDAIVAATLTPIQVEFEGTDQPGMGLPGFGGSGP